VLSLKNDEGAAAEGAATFIGAAMIFAHLPWRAAEPSRSSSKSCRAMTLLRVRSRLRRRDRRPL
jgi:hypothetical protein